MGFNRKYKSNRSCFTLLPLQIHQMISLLKNLLLINNFNFKKSYKQLLLFVALFIYSLNNKGQQLANYVNNGGFEDTLPGISTNFFEKAKFWGAIDTNRASHLVFSTLPNLNTAPNSSTGFQQPRHGNNFMLTQF
ncbi:MAG: hypothetical protein JNM96_09460, partial [Bacteroidia bacterium]|nr:hypothetical protein [Bacteroidia bacterium]